MKPQKASYTHDDEIFIQPHEIIRWHSVIYSNHLGNIFKRDKFIHVASDPLEKKPFHCLNYVSSAHGKKLLHHVSSQKGGDKLKIESNSGWGGGQQEGAGVFCLFSF